MITKWNMLENLVQILSTEYSWRLGQTYFNALCFLDPKTTNLIRGTENDCFYNDDKIFQFRNKVFEIWNNKEK